MGAGSFSVTFERQQIVDFTQGFFVEPTRILIPPPIEATRLLACARPFRIEVVQTTINVLFYHGYIETKNLQVWIGLLCVVGLLPFFIWIASKTETFFENRFRQNVSLSHSYSFVFGVLTHQCM